MWKSSSVFCEVPIFPSRQVASSFAHGQTIPGERALVHSEVVTIRVPPMRCSPEARGKGYVAAFDPADEARLEWSGSSFNPEASTSLRSTDS